MAEFHFVEDYERYVETLLKTHTIDEAMSLAVGGLYETIGTIESDLLQYLGLTERMSITDLGCGSGRLANALSKIFALDYVGIDIVQSMLDYAATRSKNTYKFLLNRELNIPLPGESQDFFVAFSVFTHLLHAESYIYLEEARRILKPGGYAVFSFLEFTFPGHWKIFENTVLDQRVAVKPPINTYIERSTIAIWSDHLDMRCVRFIGADEAPWGGNALGQSIAVLQKPEDSYT